jgi:hypothetical protein
MLEEQAYQRGLAEGCNKAYMPYEWRFDEWDVMDAVKQIQEARKKTQKPRKKAKNA